MSSYEYVSSGNFTNLVASDFTLSGYISQANDEVESLALSLGVSTFSEIERNPLHPRVLKYAVEYGLVQLYLDKIGANNTDSTLNDKYLVLYETHNNILNKLRNDITPEMLTGDADSPSETVGYSLLYRV